MEVNRAKKHTQEENEDKVERGDNKIPKITHSESINDAENTALYKWAIKTLCYSTWLGKFNQFNSNVTFEP